MIGGLIIFFLIWITVGEKYILYKLFWMGRYAEEMRLKSEFKKFF